MKPDKISDAIGMIDDDIITSADKSRKKRKSRKYLWIGAVCAAVCLCLIVTGVFGRRDAALVANAISEAEYPEAVKYPNEKDFYNDDGTWDDEAYNTAFKKWRENYISRFNQPSGYTDGLDEFCYTTMKQFLSGTDNKNRVYSPINVYMALSMLAEVTDGNSRSQILNLLGADNVENLRVKSSALWNANYSDDGTVTSILANSIWLSEDIKFEQSVMDTLAKTYYTSSYKGKMGSEEFNAMLQNWLNEQTGGLLKEQTEGIELDSNAVMALASTIYYKAKWSSQFAGSDTQERVFHSGKGDIDCEFMYQKNKQDYCWGDKFTCVYQSLENSGEMWLILPNEEVSVDELMEDKSVIDMVMNTSDWETKEEFMVNLYMPKFDVVSDMDLAEGLKKLGVTDVFDDSVSDFSAMTKDVKGISLSKVSHAARVMADEEGCIATAFTVMMTETAGLEEPAEEIDFVLDRPFMFVITGADKTPLFAGVVNQPS